MSRREPRVLLGDMLDHAREAPEAARGRSRHDLDHHRMLQVFLIHMLWGIGEAASCIPAEFIQRHPQIAWSAMIGARNVIVHGYAQVDLDVGAPSPRSYQSLPPTQNEYWPSLIRPVGAGLRDIRW